MENRQGVPYSNIINSTVTVVSDHYVKCLYNDSNIIIMETDWHSYHVIRENGVDGTSEYSPMTAKDIKEKFNVDIKEYIK